MGTVTLGDGRKLTVGEEFARLSPAEQQEWVNEVAVKFPAAPAAAAAPAAPSVPISDSQYAEPAAVPAGATPTAGAYTGSNLGPLQRTPPDDHGLARRQAMTPFEKAVSPFTEWPQHTREISTEGTHQVQRGLGQLYEGAFGSGLAGDTGKFAAGLGNVGFGAMGATFAPLSALYRSIVGQPIEDVTGIPREGTELVSQLLTPGLGFTKFGSGAPTIPKTRFTPEIPLSPEPAPGTAPRGPMIRPVDVEAPRAAQAAADLQAYNPDVQIGRAFTGTPTEQQRGQLLSNVPYAGVPLIESAKNKIPKTLEQTRDLAAAEFGTGDTVNVGERVGSNLREQAAAEKAAADAAAAEATAKAQADWQQVNQIREGAIGSAERHAAERAQQTAQETQAAVGPEQSALDMGQTNVQSMRGAHDTAESRKNTLYETARGIPAWISDRANSLLFHTVERTLEGADLPVRNIRADSAARTMLNEIERFSEQARTRQGVAPAGQSMQDVERLRANLNNIYKDASTDADKMASRRIIDTLDDWQVDAVEHHLMPGSDPRALPAILDARTANREWRTNFGYNKRDEADRIINKIVTGAEDQHIGEVGVTKALTRGDDQSALLHRRIMEATNNDPAVEQSIRSGTWHDLLHDPKTGDPLAPEAARKKIITYLEGPGRNTAERVFTPEQRQLMRAHADTVVNTAARQEAAATARKAATREAKATAPEKITAEPGDIQKLVEASIGGDRAEGVFKLLHGYAREGGDIRKLNDLVNHLPKELQGDLAGAVIRGLGKSPTTHEFSLDLFSNQWKAITPAARKVMFRHADPSHVKALDDIATVSDQLRQVQSKFGNRSGTAQNSLAGLILSAVGSSAGVSTIMGHPGKAATIVGTTIGTAVAGRKLANLLNTPAGASSIRKYAQAVERAERQQSPIHLAAVARTQRNLENTARAIGVANTSK